MKKKFDCVEMKRKGSMRIYEETKNMTPAEKLAWWRRRNEEFLRAQEKRSKVMKSKQS